MEPQEAPDPNLPHLATKEERDARLSSARLRTLEEALAQVQALKEAREEGGYKKEE